MIDSENIVDIKLAKAKKTFSFVLSKCIISKCICEGRVFLNRSNNIVLLNVIVPIHIKYYRNSSIETRCVEFACLPLI